MGNDGTDRPVDLFDYFPDGIPVKTIWHAKEEEAFATGGKMFFVFLVLW